MVLICIGGVSLFGYISTYSFTYSEFPLLQCIHFFFYWSRNMLKNNNLYALCFRSGVELSIRFSDDVDSDHVIIVKRIGQIKISDISR